MRKYVLILVGLLFAAGIAGCGGSGAAATVVAGNATLAITPDEITQKTFSIKVDETLKLSYVFGNHSATWGTAAGGTKQGTWQVTNGSLILTENSPSTFSQTLTRIQKENNPNYWLVYDPATKSNSRFYVGSVDPNFDPTFMGGARLGGANLPQTPKTVKVTTFAGRLPGAAGFADTSAGQPTFNQPVDITYDGVKNQYYVLDYNNGAIRIIDTAGNVTTRTCFSDTSPTLPVTFNAPQGITTDGHSIYVSDTGNHLIRKVEIDNGLTTTFAGSVSGAIDAVGTAAAFKSPAGITTDGTNLYVADSGNHTIRKIVISTQAVSTLAGSAGNLGASDGTFTAARFNSPVRLTTDGSKLFVTDFNNRTVRSVQIATGEVTTIAGNAGEKAAQIDGFGGAALFSHPTGITTDGTNLYVTDFNSIILPKPGAAPTDANLFFNLIRKIVISSGQVLPIAGSKNYPEDAVEGDGSNARFAGPRGIIWDGTSLLVTNGTYTFDTDGVSIFNPVSAYNVIFKITPL